MISNPLKSVFSANLSCISKNQSQIFALSNLISIRRSAKASFTCVRIEVSAERNLEASVLTSGVYASNLGLCAIISSQNAGSLSTWFA